MPDRCHVDYCDCCRDPWTRSAVPVPPTNRSGDACLESSGRCFPSFVLGCSSSGCWRFGRTIYRRLRFDGACIPCSRRRLVVVVKPFWWRRGVYPPRLYRWRIDSKRPKCLRSSGWRWPGRKFHRRECLEIVHQSMPRLLLPSTDSLVPWANGSREIKKWI